MRVVLCSLLIALALAEPASAERVNKTLAVEPDGVVHVSNVAGSIEIRGWDRSEVELDATHGSGVERIDFETRGGRTMIRVITPRHSSSSDVNAHLRIRVPRQSELDVSAVSASIQTFDVAGEQRLTSVSGAVRAELGNEDAEIKTVSGSVRLTGGSEGAEIRISTVSGDVDLSRGAGDLEVTTVSGAVDLDVNNGGDVRARTTSGELKLRGNFRADSSIDVETVSGDSSLNVRMPRGFKYDVTSFSGRLDSCFNKEPEQQRYGPRSRLAGVRGEGEGEIRARSMSGSVRICDR